MKLQHFLAVPLLLAAASIAVPGTRFAASAQAPLPPSASGSVDVQSARRARIRLDGRWKFSPAQSAGVEAGKAPKEGWGTIPVPGSWRRRQDTIEPGVGPQWAGFEGQKLAGAWYERRFTVPADWAGRHISIDFQRISTDATVWIDDRPAGKVRWPEGEIDITPLVTPGQEVTLRAFVVATLDRAEALVLMGNEPGQNFTAKAELQSAGIVGSVTLQSRPGGAHLSDVYIKPSTRKKQLGIDIELSGVTQSGPVQIVASLLDEKGREEKQFTATVNVSAAPTQRVQTAWSWANPRLWDDKQPNLYTLRLSARGPGIDDETATRFGFREVWVAGRDVFFNGTPFRMRPFLLNSAGAGEGAKRLSEARELGYNFGELWPEDIEARSRDARYTDWFEVADREGFPLSGIMPHMGWMGGQINSPEKRAAYRADAERLMRRYRNHPSIILWGTSGNMMGGSHDPRNAGLREASKASDTRRGSQSAQAVPLAEEGVRILKSLDPTRPVLIHNGGPAGDFYTINNYLNFIPLQEREEWLSTYAQKGDMPYMHVEFGTPVSLSLMRGRNGFRGAMLSESFLSEYAAIYLGDAAYRREPAEYRKRLAELFEKDQSYAWSLGMKERDYAPAWLTLQDLFIRNTWRSWRTMGITGGMIPWDEGYVRLNGALTPAGKAMRASNSETLAWIAGAAQTGDIAAFTAKDHAYFGGERVRKQIALLNDARAAQKYTVRWTATVNNKAVGSGTASGSLRVGHTLFVPLAFAAPAAAGKANGVITLDAVIGGDRHTDRFDFRVWSRPAAAKGTVSVFDPDGRTTVLLRTLGYTVAPWKGQSNSRLLVIGRNGLKSGLKLPGDLKKFVQNGGRVLVSEQDPHWLRENLGVRVSYYQSRRLWKVGDSPATLGLDETDLRDWRGSSTLLSPRPDYNNERSPDTQLSKTTYPYTGWRWGNRGTVASAAIEKPHRSGWRPLLETEFDLAYSPLMELDCGKGRILWSQLDLEDHAALDPVARRLARQVIEYARTAPLAPRVPTGYIGGESGSALLQSLGVPFRQITTLPASGLVVIGADAAIPDAQLTAFARGGGKALFLPRRDAQGSAGLRLQQTTDFIGSLQAPNWPEARGLSASDLRWRTAGSAWLVAGGDGWQVGADGLLARRRVGKGVLVWSQIDPTVLPADEKTYFRYTRWRQTRALSQVLANLGAAFTADERFFSPRPEAAAPTVAVAGDWRARQFRRLPASPSSDKGYDDLGISADAKRAVAADFRDTDWQVVQAPGDMERYGGAWANADGEAVFRKSVAVQDALRGQDLTLSLGTLDDFDDTYFNGVRVGGVGKENSASYSVKREYTIPANLVKPGRNVIAVRVWDRFGGGGFTANTPAEMQLKSTRIPPRAAGLYHPDYRDDWELGDEPYRYYNW